MLQDGVEYEYDPKGYYHPSILYEALSKFNKDLERCKISNNCLNSMFGYGMRIFGRRKNEDYLDTLSIIDSYEICLTGKSTKSAGYPYFCTKMDVEYNDVINNINSLLDGSSTNYYTLFSRNQGKFKCRPV
jgi:hypothetical protein